MDDLYEILGISKDATDEEIKKAFRKRAVETHPDKNNGESKGFSDVAKAYQILSDRKSRLRYDRRGEIETDEDSLRVASIKELQRIILQLFEELADEVFYIDLVAKIKDILEGNITKAKNDIVDIRKNIRKLRRYKKKFVYNGTDGKDFATLAITDRIYTEYGTIEEKIKNTRKYQYMLNLISVYSYIPEELDVKGTPFEGKTFEQIVALLLSTEGKEKRDAGT